MKFNKSKYNGARYFLTILDDCTRITWTYLLKDKTETYQNIYNFICYVKNQFAVTIRCIRSDNGTEFTQGKCANLFSKEGIIHQKSAPYTPQQNGRVERKHKHLIETARSLRIHAGLPIKFWGECVSIACYLINRLPSSIIS